MKILIDDERTFADMDFIVRTPRAAAKLISNIDISDAIVYLDHDLGDEEDNGYTIAMFMIAKKNIPKEIHLVTNNPIGRGRMAAAFEHDAGYKRVTGMLLIRQGD